METGFMRTISWKTIAPILVLIATIAGCSVFRQQPSAAPSAIGGNMITIKVQSYKFDPALIRAENPALFIFQVINATGSEQNLTLKSPKGQVIKSFNISPGGTAISNIELPDYGAYEFYSDKRFHATMGQKGRIQVGGAK
jgi:hypothetical protein